MAFPAGFNSRAIMPYGMKTVASICIGLSALVSVEQAVAAECAPIAIPKHYGPYDYVSEHSYVGIVDAFHFTPKVESLIGGESGYLGEDLSYTLNASPNHHRALAAIMRWGMKTNNQQPPNLKYSIECYFDRATRFRPKDTVVRSLYALYLAQLKRPSEAIEQLDYAAIVVDDNAVSHYNIGLTYFELGEFEKALQQAHLALKLGYERTELADRLKQVNRWKEPAE